jgi:ketosteroid isomerase-like protein
MNDQDLINRAYQAFNARDIDSALALLQPDVEWPNGWEGGYVHGHHEVRQYWLRQWQEIDPEVIPVSMQGKPNGQLEVNVHQVIKDRAGEVISDGFVKHLYTLENGKIRRMDIDII